MLVKRLMTRDPVACKTTDGVAEVARLMRSKGVGFVVALRGSKVAGIVTDRQLALRVVAEGSDPRDLKAQDVMTHDPATIRPDADLLEAIATMREAGVVRRLPVVDARGRLVGVLSLSDIAVILREIFDAFLLEETRHALTEARVPTGGKAVGKLARKRASGARSKRSSRELGEPAVAPRRIPAYSG